MNRSARPTSLMAASRRRCSGGSHGMTRVVTLGEVMLRLKSPGFERLFQSPTLEATFGGAEANVAASLAQFGVDARFVIGDSREQRRRRVHRVAARVRRRHVDGAAAGRAPRRLLSRERREPTAVARHVRSRGLVDRRPRSASDFDWDAVFDGADWFHVSGRHAGDQRDRRPSCRSRPRGRRVSVGSPSRATTTIARISGSTARRRRR